MGSGVVGVGPRGVSGSIPANLTSKTMQTICNYSLQGLDILE